MAARRKGTVLCRAGCTFDGGADRVRSELGDAGRGRAKTALSDAARQRRGGNIPGLMSKQQYAVASDGRFLMNVAVEAATAPPITVVLNWDAALKK